MEVNGEVAERIERRLDALGLRPEEVDAKVGLPPGTTERLGAGQGPIPGGRFLRGLCAALDADEAYLLGLEPGDLVPAELLVEPEWRRSRACGTPPSRGTPASRAGPSVPMRRACSVEAARSAPLRRRVAGGVFAGQALYASPTCVPAGGGAVAHRRAVPPRR
jgi:hypothetical protein